MAKRDSNGRFVKGENIKDISGRRYGKLVAVKVDRVENGRTYWLCQCDCGNQKSIRSDCLPRIQSCGCVKKEQDVHNLHITNHHGMANHPAFNTWSNIIARCCKPNDPAYKDYGGRGIKVCPEWKDARVFCKWMDDNGYEKGLSVERIDVNGNYDPKNCKLIPIDEQPYNKRNTVYALTDRGVIAVAWEARQNGISLKTAKNRIERGEWLYERIFHKGRLSKDV